MPLLGEIVRHRLMVSAHRRQFDGGVGEVQVRVLPFGKHRLCIAVSAQQVLGESHGDSHLATPHRTTQHQRMGQPLLLFHLKQPFLHLLLSYDLLEHILLVIVTVVTIVIVWRPPRRSRRQTRYRNGCS